MCYKESVFYGKFVLILKTLPLKKQRFLLYGSCILIIDRPIVKMAVNAGRHGHPFFKSLCEFALRLIAHIQRNGCDRLINSLWMKR